MPTKPLLEVLAGKRVDPPPVWIMRQAGRYLPEYRATRAGAGGFLDLCYTPELATEVTLQPIRRFGFDAAIVFSDILVVPHALGQAVGFAEGEGPRLARLEGMADLARLSGGLDLERLEPVFQTLRNLRGALPATTALIGFCGAPWTVAGYMMVGRGGEALEEARAIGYRDPGFVDAVIGRLEQASIAYLSAQVEAGAEVLQIFESFAGSLPALLFERWSLGPVSRIVAGVKARHPSVPIIVFARGAGANHRAVAARSGADAVGLDWTVSLDFGREVQALKPVQGNLDPLVVVTGGAAMESAARAILEGFSGGPHIFNLGHGIVPQTPIAHVERLIEIVRSRG